ncbi:MAG: ankyrin repeat domain-containing protein [Verrucomicrobia bacterium]|nr:ankyrin repeat domain-containing protein [Verrucomicrobiota bacterium]
MSSVSNVDGKSVVFLSSQFDPNHAFISTESGLNKRISVLKEDGLSVDHITSFKTFAEVAEFLMQKFPNGIHMMTWRGHGNYDRFKLSEDPCGIAYMRADAPSHESVVKICQAIEKGGILATESCFNGAGKENLLKHLAGLCQSGVVVIGSRIDQMDIQIQPGVPHHYRCFSLTGNDETRIYYKTRAGLVQNISPKHVDILWKFLGNSPATFDLCYQLLGERNDPESYAAVLRENQVLLEPYLSDVDAIKQSLLSVPVCRSTASPIWQQILDDLEKHTGDALVHELQIPVSQRTSKLVIEEDKMTWAGRSLTAQEVAYQFLLGMAMLQQHRALFQLLDNSKQDISDSKLAECVYALTGLALHPDKEMPFSDKLSMAIQTVKKSYLLAKENGRVDKWAEVLVRESGGCVDATISGLQEFYGEEILSGPQLTEREANYLDTDYQLERWMQERFDLDGLERFNHFKENLQHFAKRKLIDREQRNNVVNIINGDNSTSLSNQIHFINRIGVFDKSEWIKLAIQSDFTEILPLLCSDNTINSPNQFGQTPLSLAIGNRHSHSVEVLLWLGADPNLQFGDGSTPLYLATYQRNYKIINLLVNAGADPFFKSPSVLSAYEIAQLYDDDQAGNALLGEYFSDDDLGKGEEEWLSNEQGSP